MLSLSRIFEKGRNHIFIPAQELDLKEVQGQGKVGFKTSLRDYFHSKEFRVAGRKHNPIVQNMNDYVQWYFYDRMNFGAGTNVPVNFKHFVTPIGQGTGLIGGGAKTKSDTNLEQPSRINDPGWLNAIGIGFYFDTKNLLLDIQNFFQAAYLEFWAGGKVYVEGPHVAFPAGWGLFGVSTATAQQTFSNGIARLSNMFDLRLPAGMTLGTDAKGRLVTSDGLTGVGIPQGQLLKVENNLPGGVLALTAANATPNAGNGLAITAYLVGTYSRGVQ